MAKVYLPISDPYNAEITKEWGTFNPSAVRAFAKLFHTLVSWDIVGTFFLYLFPTLTHAQLKALINSRLIKLASASDEEINSIHERIPS